MAFLFYTTILRHHCNQVCTNQCLAEKTDFKQCIHRYFFPRLLAQKSVLSLLSSSLSSLHLIILHCLLFFNSMTFKCSTFSDVGKNKCIRHLPTYYIIYTYSYAHIWTISILDWIPYGQSQFQNLTLVIIFIFNISNVALGILPYF